MQPEPNLRSDPRCSSKWLATFAGVLAVIVIASCGSEDLIFPGDIPTVTPSPVETPTCLPAGDACSVASDCCSGECVTTDGVDFLCQ